MSTLLESNPDYAKVRVINVDWDEFGSAPISSELDVRRQGTLIVFNKGEEVTRAVGETSEDAIDALFKAVM